jgi:hypothetical protein
MASNALEVRIRGEIGRFEGHLSYAFGKANNNTGESWRLPSSLPVPGENPEHHPRRGDALKVIRPRGKLEHVRQGTRNPKLAI